MAKINKNFPGQNAYLHPTECEDYGACGAHWQDVRDSGANFIRIGGKSYDECLRNALEAPGTPDFDKFEDSGLFNYDDFIPVVQLSYYQTDTAIWTDPEAAASHLLEYVVTPLYLEKGVRYFTIGNEPNSVDSPYQEAIANGHYQSTAQEIYAYVSAIATAIRAEYTDVFLLGPELTHYDEELVNALTEGEYNILPYIDVFTFHYYPFNSLANAAVDYQIPATRENIINVLRDITPVYFANGNGVTPLETRLGCLHGIIAASGYPDVQIAITEANLCYGNSADYNAETGGANGFLTGQFWAELMAVGMSKNIMTINFWSVLEGTADDGYATDIGYISSQPENPFKSTYYHFQMVAQHFKGTFKWATITSDTNSHLIKAFAAKNAREIAVMVLNQDVSGSAARPVRIKLNKKSFTFAAANEVHVNIDFGIRKAHEDSINGEETILFLFDGTDSFNFKEKHTYSISNCNVSDPTLNFPPVIWP